MIERYQKGSAAFSMMIILLVLVGLIYVWDSSDAPHDRVEAVIEWGQQTPEGTAMLQAFFNRYPVPSNQQLRQVKKDLNALSLLQESRRVTGNANINAVPQEPSNQKLFTQLTHAYETLSAKPLSEMAVEEQAQYYLLWLIQCAPALIALVCLITIITFLIRLTHQKQ